MKKRGRAPTSTFGAQKRPRRSFGRKGDGKRRSGDFKKTYLCSKTVIMVQWKIAIFGDLPLKVIIHFQPQLMDLIFHPWDASLIKRPRKNSSLRTNCLATGVVHQQPLGKLYCFILKIPLYLRISEGSKQFFGHNLSRFTCLENGPNKPTSGRKLPEIHAAPRLPDVLTALRRPFFGNSWRKLQDQPSKSTGFQTPFLGSEKEC